jgi:carbon-monoxide dehydrogenase medium subunit
MQVRNRGTIGGSLAHADPAADYPPVVLALGAEIDAVGPNGKRTLKADDFFTGTFTTALAPDEVLTEVRVPRTDKRGMGAAYKELQHPASHYAVVGVAVWLHIDGDKVSDVRVGVTGATDHAVRALKMEDALRGNMMDDDLMASAAERATEGLECVGDMFASASYRAHLVQVYAKRALEAAHGRVHHMS